MKPTKFNCVSCHPVPLGQQTNMNREKVLDINFYHFLPTLVWESWFDTHCHFCHHQWIIQCHRFLRRKLGKKIYLDQTLQGRINQGPGLLWGRWLGSATPWRKSIAMEITTLGFPCSHDPSIRTPLPMDCFQSIPRGFLIFYCRILQKLRVRCREAKCHGSPLRRIAIPEIPPCAPGSGVVVNTGANVSKDLHTQVEYRLTCFEFADTTHGNPWIIRFYPHRIELNGSLP